MPLKQKDFHSELINVRKEFLHEVTILQKEHEQKIKQILKKIQLRQIEQIKKKIQLRAN